MNKFEKKLYEAHSAIQAAKSLAKGKKRGAFLDVFMLQTFCLHFGPFSAPKAEREFLKLVKQELHDNRLGEVFYKEDYSNA